MSIRHDYLDLSRILVSSCTRRYVYRESMHCVTIRCDVANLGQRCFLLWICSFKIILLLTKIQIRRKVSSLINTCLFWMTMYEFSLSPVWPERGSRDLTRSDKLTTIGLRLVPKFESQCQSIYQQRSLTQLIANKILGFLGMQLLVNL